MKKPEIKDNDNGVIFASVGGITLQRWVYGPETHAEKMRQAWYWCDGYMCAKGAPLKQVGIDQ